MKIETIVCPEQATFLLDCTLIHPTVQLGNSSGTLWLHTCTPDCTTKIRRRFMIFRLYDSGKLVGRFMIAHLFSGLYDSIIRWRFIWFPDCTTRKFVGHFMIPYLLSGLYDSGNSSGFYDLRPYNSETRQGVVLPTVRLKNSLRLYDCTIVLPIVGLGRSSASYMIVQFFGL